jgi:hypothetical protein
MRLSVQLLAEIGMGDRNQRPGSLVNTHAEKINPTVFGYDVVDVAATGNHAGPGR